MVWVDVGGVILQSRGRRVTVRVLTGGSQRLTSRRLVHVSHQTKHTKQTQLGYYPCLCHERNVSPLPELMTRENHLTWLRSPDLPSSHDCPTAGCP